MLVEFYSEVETDVHQVALVIITPIGDRRNYADDSDGQRQKSHVQSMLQDRCVQGRFKHIDFTTSHLGRLYIQLMLAKRPVYFNFHDIFFAVDTQLMSYTIRKFFFVSRVLMRKHVANSSV